MNHFHHHEHHHSDIPLFIFGSYVVGYLAGRTVAVLWIHGPVEARGVRRLAHVKPAPMSPAPPVTDVAAGDAPTRKRAA